MERTLRSKMEDYVRLTDEEFASFFGLLQIKRFAKREHLLSVGQVCKNAYFILEGCIRYYNLIDGEEHTGQFFFEGAWYSDYESFLSGRPSEQSIQALEPTTVALLSKHQLEELYREVPKFERFGRLMAENAFMGLRRRTESLTQLSAAERYAELVRRRPKVVRRVPQRYIASYLGIRPQSLSRIRKK